MLRLLFALCTGLPLLFRVGSRLGNLIPPSLLRMRLSGIYELMVPGDSPCRTASTGQTPVRWIGSRQDAASLSDVADPQCIAIWDGARVRGVVASSAGKSVGVAWLARDDFAEPELGFRWRLAPDEVWLFGASVVRADRGRGVYQSILNYLRSELASEGLSRIVLAVSAGNRPSERAHANQGADRIGILLAVRIGPLVWCISEGEIRREGSLGLSWGSPISLRTRGG